MATTAAAGVKTNVRNMQGITQPSNRVVAITIRHVADRASHTSATDSTPAPIA